MPKPALADFATILNKDNTEPLFDLAWGVFQIAEDATAKTPAEARGALNVYSQDEVYTKSEVDARIADWEATVTLLDARVSLLDSRIASLELRVAALENP